MRQWGAGAASVVAVLTLVSCSRPQPPKPPAAPPKAAKPLPEPSTAAAEALAALRAAAKPVSSYQMTMNSAGAEITVWASLKDGQTTRYKVRTDPASYMLHDLPAKSVYTVTDKPKRAVQKHMAADAKMPPTPVETMVRLASGASAISDETVDGVACAKVTASHSGKAEIIVWLDKQYALPRQMQSGGVTVKLVYQHINEVPDDEFKLPEGVPVVDGGNIAAPVHGTGMPKAGAKSPPMPEMPAGHPAPGTGK
ncbi:MAG: hypothetical protein HZB16_16125 [Armatimonadetes bacterium]|nr:hypothetical protein [Armatimonadota bacterium]